MSNHTTATSGISSNGNGALQRCVSLADGALSPDQRVNYEFGLVLGVDEFRQEQRYFLEKDYLHNRGLHGYGTVSGLRVTASRPADDSDEVLITVEPGIAVDQFGRVFVIREEQCARLGAWYAHQVQEGEAPPLASPPEPLRAYVIAHYDECLDALVPIPGQPCAQAEATMAPSRIRDSVDVELRWQPPQMTAWEAVRALADLLAGVRFVEGLPPELSDESTLIDLVRGLADPPDMAPCREVAPAAPASPPAGVLQLPTETARQVLDRILAVWVTEVRPAIRDRVDLIEPGSDRDVESGVLLACIDFMPALPFVAGDPQIDDARVDNLDRPYLLHTQLIQELLLLGGGEAVEAGGLEEFATLQVIDGHTLRAWVHHVEPLSGVGDPLASVTVTVNDRVVALDGVAPVAGVDNLFEVATTQGVDNQMATGDRVAVSFSLGAWQETVSGRPLLDVLDAAAVGYVGRDGGTINVYTVVERLLPSRDLVTISTQMRGDRAAGVHLWFHTNEPVRLPATVPVRRGPTVAASDYAAATPNNVQFSHEWLLTGPGNTRLQDGELLLIDFDTATVKVGSDLVTLSDVIAANHLSLVGYDGRQTVRAFHEVEIPVRLATGPSIDEILLEIARRLPTQPFVTITVHDNDNVPVFEFWFHVDRRWDSPEAVVFLEEPRFILLAEHPNGPGVGDIKLAPELRDFPPDAFNVVPIQSNVYQVEVDRNIWAELGSRYLRFVFLAPETIVIVNGNDMSLEDYIGESRIKFEGHNGEDAIVAFVRVPGQGEIG